MPSGGHCALGWLVRQAHARLRDGNIASNRGSFILLRPRAPRRPIDRPRPDKCQTGESRTSCSDSEARGRFIAKQQGAEGQAWPETKLLAEEGGGGGGLETEALTPDGCEKDVHCESIIRIDGASNFPNPSPVGGRGGIIFIAVYILASPHRGSHASSPPSWPSILQSLLGLPEIYKFLYPHRHGESWIPPSPSPLLCELERLPT